MYGYLHVHSIVDCSYLFDTIAILDPVDKKMLCWIKIITIYGNFVNLADICHTTPLDIWLWNQVSYTECDNVPNQSHVCSILAKHTSALVGWNIVTKMIYYSRGRAIRILLLLTKKGNYSKHSPLVKLASTYLSLAQV